VTLDSGLTAFGLVDTITIEPYVSETAARVATYGTAVTYAAQVMPWTARPIMTSHGVEIQPAGFARIEGRIAVDERSRITLPSDCLIAGTRNPPLRAVQPGPANNLNLDYTDLIF